MTKKLLPIIFVLFFSFSLIQTPFDASGSLFIATSTSWGTSTNPVEVGPGDKNVPLTITLQYHGEWAITTLRAELNLPSAFTNIDGGNIAVAYSAGMASNAVFSLVFNLNIDANASIKDYTLPLHFVFDTVFSDDSEETINLNVQLKGKSEITFEASSNYLNPGQVNELTITLNNLGKGGVSEVSTYISVPTQMSILTRLPTIDDLDGLSSIKFNVSVYVASAAANLPISITFSATYKDAYLDNRSISKTLGFIVKSLRTASSISLSIQPTTLITGKVNNLTIAVSNVADSPISSVLISFGTTGGQVTWLEPDIAQIDKLLPEESVIIQARVYVPPLAATSATLQISLKYYDGSNTLSQEVRNIGFLSQGVIDLKLVDYSNMPEHPTPGQVFSITATLTNIGTITASAVTATPDLPEGFRIFGSRSVFIGDMQLNTPTTFTLSLFVANTTMPNEYQIPIELSYFDNLRTPKTLTINLPVEVIEKTSTTSSSTGSNAAGGGLLSLLPLVFIGAAMLGVGFLLGKRYKKK